LETSITTFFVPSPLETFLLASLGDQQSVPLIESVMKPILTRLRNVCALVFSILCWLSVAPAAHAGQALLDFETSYSPVSTSYIDYGVSFDGNESVVTGGVSNYPSGIWYLDIGSSTT
jgi:hypothetical protein